MKAIVQAISSAIRKGGNEIEDLLLNLEKKGTDLEAEDKITEAIAEYQIVSDLDQNPQLTVMARFKMGMIMQRVPLRSVE